MVWASDFDASLGRTGAVGAGVDDAELLLDGERVLSRADVEVESDGRVEDALESVWLLDSLDLDTPQSVLPLDAVFGRSLQWSAWGGFDSGRGVACCA